MARVDPQLIERWRGLGDRQVDLIVHVKGDLQTHSAELEARGVTVRRRFRLVDSLGIRCSARAAVELVRVSWITRIEPDREVRALGR